MSSFVQNYWTDDLWDRWQRLLLPLDIDAQVELLSERNAFMRRHEDLGTAVLLFLISKERA